MLDRVESALLEGILTYKQGWITAAIFLLKNKRKEIYNEFNFNKELEDIKIIFEKNDNTKEQTIDNTPPTLSQELSNNNNANNIDWNKLEYETN